MVHFLEQVSLSDKPRKDIDLKIEPRVERANCKFETFEGKEAIFEVIVDDVNFFVELSLRELNHIHFL